MMSFKCCPKENKTVLNVIRDPRIIGCHMDSCMAYG